MVFYIRLIVTAEIRTILFDSLAILAVIIKEYFIPEVEMPPDQDICILIILVCQISSRDRIISACHDFISTSSCAS